VQPATTPSPIEFYVALCLLLPLLSFFVSFLISDRYAWAISFTSPFFQLVSAFCACVIFLRMQNNSYTVTMEWFHAGNFTFSADLQLNPLSTLMLPVVSVVAFLVQLYSTGYMAGSAGNRKYFAMLSFFTFSMLGLVLANNLLLLFVFWELVGFSSYALIGHDKQDLAAAAAAKKAFIMNRVGDAAFLTGLLILATQAGSLDIGMLHDFDARDPWKSAAALCLLGGVAGKSAQFPLFNWLPDAMAGPTPVSALIHAATMVAAGVFLLARLAPLFSDTALVVVAIVGISTAVLAALAALAQTDLKKILAYSTISQLGLMVSAAGAGAPEAAMMHLVSHACFKACLFLSAGAVIHALHQAQHQAHQEFDVQDIRLLGGLRKKMPFTFLAFVVSGAALAGLPFTAGFLSKDALFTAMTAWAQNGGGWRWALPVAAFAVSFLTVLYTFRLITVVFLGEEKATRHMPVTEVPAVMRMPLLVLMAASLWLLLSWNPLDFTGWLYALLHSGPEVHVGGIVWISAAWSLLALGVAYRVYGAGSTVHSSQSTVGSLQVKAEGLQPQGFKKNGLLLNAFYVDAGYKWLARGPLMVLANATARVDTRWLDRALHGLAYAQLTLAHLVGWIDRAVVDGAVRMVATIARMIGSFARSFQGGQIQLYIFWGVLAWIIFLIWMLN
jgi:NADH-quinone oxidoreductase subunit L